MAFWHDNNAVLVCWGMMGMWHAHIAVCYTTNKIFYFVKRASLGKSLTAACLNIFENTPIKMLNCGEPFSLII
jgi:hypothetical protein